MDPAVYARHYGVQSEGNKGTVTRVACGEILYRREVDCYKRDMRYKVNSIRKEQKKLRHSMRGYRRKLRETEKRHQQLEDGHAINSQQKSHAMPKIGMSLEDECIRPVFTSNKDEDRRHKNNIVHHDHYNQDVNSADTLLTSPSYGRLPPLNRYSPVSIHHSAEGQDLPSPQTQRLAEVDEVEPAPRPELENVGRVLRRGSGKIGAGSHRRLLTEEDDDNYSMLSDSSDEENDKRDDVIEIVSFRHGRFIRENTPLSLIKMNSAYFKPVESETVNEMHRNISEGPNETEESNREGGIEANADESVFPNATAGASQNEDDPINETRGKRHVSLPNEIKSIHAPVILLPPDSGDKMAEAEERSQELRQRRRSKKKSVVSYGDLIKLQHTTNTKKLFSLVDRLTESTESSVTLPEKKRASYAHDPRENVVLKRRAHAQPTQMVGSSLTTYGSVFYTMKYGYVSEAPEPAMDRMNLLPSKTGTPGFDLKSTNSFLSHTSFNTARLSSYPDDSVSAPPDNWMNRFSNLELGLDEPDFVGGQKMTISEPGIRHSHQDVGDLLDIVSKANVSATKTEARESRRSSLLAASNYVSQRRSRGSISKKVKVSNTQQAQRERDLFHKGRRSSVYTEPAGALHQQLADERKESWSSALSRIKMVHTLVDLTHIL